MRLTEQDGKKILAEAFPQLVEAPARMFGEDGQPLPPMKQHETSPEERDARRDALQITYCGKQKHSLMKAMVIMESRTATWKRVSAAEDPEYRPEHLTDTPNPWIVELVHQDLDTLRAAGKSKRHFELPDSRTDGICPKCTGSGEEPCATCRGETADECWWCAGTGFRKGYNIKCARCHGEGKLKCESCQGSMRQACKPCSGQGTGHYAINIEIRVRRIDFPPFPISGLIPAPHLRNSPDAVRSAAITRAWSLIQRLTESSTAKGSSAYFPVSAACGWETSVSHLVQVEVPLQAKLKRTGSESRLKSTSLSSRKIRTATRFFIIPSDSDLRPAEMTQDEFVDAVVLDRGGDVELGEDGVEYGAVSNTDDLPTRNSVSIATPVRGLFRTPSTHNLRLADSRPTTPTGSRPTTPKFWQSRPTTPQNGIASTPTSPAVKSSMDLSRSATGSSKGGKGLFRTRSMTKLLNR